MDAEGLYLSKGLPKTISLALKILTRLFFWFFVFEVLLSTLGIVLVLYGFPEVHRFINLPTLVFVPGLISCFITFHFTMKEVEDEFKKGLA